MKGRLLHSENLQFDAGAGRRLPTVTFSVENDKVFMTGKFIIGGKHLYGITLAARSSQRRVAGDSLHPITQIDAALAAMSGA